MAHCGKITVIAGPMFSGKTTALFNRYEAAEHLEGSRVIISKLHDDGTGSSHIAFRDGSEGTEPSYVKCRDGRKLNTIQLRRLWDFENTRQRIHGHWKRIFIDEGQFFPDLVDFCDSYANDGAIITVTILNRDYTGRAFPYTEKLFSHADEWIQLCAHCDYCDLDHTREPCAAFTVRVAPITAEQGCIGQGKDLYKAACRSCYYDRKINPYLSY